MSKESLNDLTAPRQNDCEHEYIGHDEGVPYCGKCGTVKLQRRQHTAAPDVVERVAKEIYDTHESDVINMTDCREAAKAAIAAMGATEIRNEESTLGGKSPSSAELDSQAPANLSSSEVSGVNDAFNTHISEKPRSYESFADYREGFFEGYYTASHKPVMGSLAKLQHEYDSTRGLWCIDRDPSKVDHDWIKQNAFQLK